MWCVVGLRMRNGAKRKRERVKNFVSIFILYYILDVYYVICAYYTL